MRLSATLALVGATTLANLSYDAAADGAAPVVTLNAGHAAMSDAEAAARRHLGQFLDHVLQDDGAAVEGAAVKIAVTTGDDRAEVIWVTPFARISEGGFLGVLANAPQDIGDASVGDAIAFEHSQVRDWSFVGKDARLYGSFTTRVLLPHIAQDQAAKVAALLSDLPVPAEWN